MRAALATLVLAFASVACAGSSSGRSGEETQALTAFYPLAFVAREVGGERVDVTNLTASGAEPHDLELTSGEIRSLAEADVFFWLGGGFQPAVEDVVDELDGAVDVLEGLPGARAGDPHVWLDPVLMRAVAERVTDRLRAADPAGADVYETRAEALESKLRALDDDFSEGLSDCWQRAFVTSHDAFSYLAHRYDLEQIGIAGVDPEAEPTPQSVLAAARFARDNDVTTIFYERLVSPRIAQAVADEVGVSTAVLDPLEIGPERGDYLSVMRDNLDALSHALGCE